MEFKIVKNSKEVVLIEVIFEDDIDSMSNSGFSGKEKFIKITKGKNHTITLYNDDKKSYCSFNFGEGGYTLISKELEVLKKKVLRFLLSERIQIKKNVDTIETKLKIMPPIKGLGMADHYCVHLGGGFATFLKTEDEIKELFGDYQIQHTYTASTGATVMEAKLDDL